MKLKYDNLLGKEWVMNEQDCFTLTSNFYDQNFGIKIPNFARPNPWDPDKLDLIKLMPPRAGFKLVEPDFADIRPGDALAMAINSSNASHLAVYVGDNELIHHLWNRDSNKELLRPYWRMATLYVWRHPDIPDLRPQMPQTPFEEILRARFPR